jgi:hypothetical protein
MCASSEAKGSKGQANGLADTYRVLEKTGGM